MDECLSRIEFSQFFGSVEEEMTFFTGDVVFQIKNIHTETLKMVNNNDEIMDDIYKQTTMEEVMDVFWKNVAATVIIKTHDKAAVIYGYNSDTCKYYGMFDSVQPNASIQTIASYHALPWIEECKGFELFDKDRVKITDNMKTGKEVLYPSLGFCKNNKKPDRDLAFLGLAKRGFCFSLKLK